MKSKKWLSGFLALALCANAMSAGAGALETPAPRSTDTQTSSAEETVYVNSYGGSDRSILFDDNWKFNLGDASGAQNEVYNDSTWRTVNLPHDYSIEQDFTQSGEAESGYLPGGTGWYRKSFTVSPAWENKRVSIDFGGVYMNATVYLNGEQLGTHPYGYTPFSFELPADKLKYDGENVIAVRTENDIPSSRWYSGSGIYRSVHLTVTNPVHVARYGTTVTATRAGAVNVVSEIANDGAEQAQVTVTNAVYESGSETPVVTSDASAETAVAAGASQKITSSVTVSDPKIWDLGDPNMYFVRTEVKVGNEVVDSYDTDFGFREFAFNADTGFSLNGNNVKLKGMCMHHDQGALGSEAWYRATERQVEILQGMGCNAIRVTHNPASDELIDICNKKGMLVIEEMFDGWQLPKNGNSNDYSEWFNETIGADNAIVDGAAGMQWAQFDLQETVRRGKNSPAIIAWSLGNEVQEGTSSGLSQTYVDNAKKLLDWGKEIDPIRPFTTGDNTRGGTPAYNSVVADAGGIVGYNYYNGGNDSIPGAHTAHPTWILYGAETASCTNSRGVYDRKGSQTDKNGDRKLTSYDKSSVGWGATASKSWWYTVQNDFNAGEFVWTGFDYIGEPTPWNGTGGGAVGGWPSPKSSYFGVVDTNGLPKDNYYLYQAMWNDDVHTLHVLPTWDEADVAKDGNGKVEVVVYSDAPAVKLYLNGNEVGTAVSTETTTAAGHKYRTFASGTGDFAAGSGDTSLYATFNVPYATGTLTAKAFEANGTTEITNTQGRATVKTTSGASKLTAAADRGEITADGRDLSYVTIDVKDKDGNIVNGAANEISVSVSGEGTLVGLDNGVQVDHTSYQAASRTAGAGQLVAIVQSTKQAGSFTLSANASGLSGANTVVTTTPAETTGSTEKYVVSYQLSKNYYVKLNNVPELPTAVQVNYSDGTASEQKDVTWETYDKENLKTTGSFTVSGQIAGTSIKPVVNINMMDEVAALLNYSAAILKGSKPNLPSSRPAIMADGTVLDVEFPVTWETPEEGAFGSVGAVTVNGAAQIFGKQVPVTATIRVSEGSVIVGGNVAKQADGLFLDSADNKPQGIENVRDGNADTAWTGAGDILFRYATAQNLNQIRLTFQGSVPAGVSCSWSGDGVNYTPIAVQPSTAGTTQTYELNGLIPAVWVKLSLPRCALAEAELIVGTPDFPINSSAELTGMTVNGIPVDAASLAAREYLTKTEKIETLAVKNPENVSYTVLDPQENVVRILTESEDHFAHDEYRIRLNAATNGQPGPADDDSLDYDRTKTTPTGGSVENREGTEGPFNLAIDNIPGTWWHSQWNENLKDQPEKRWFQLELEEPTKLSALRYLPRTGQTNGTVSEYKIEVSVDNSNWETVATGTWTSTVDWKLAPFDKAVTAKYVKLWGLSTYGDGDQQNKFMTAAEVRVRVADDTLNLAAAEVTVSGEYEWTGSPVEPPSENVTVKFGDKTLIYDTDYTLRYENNTEAGTAKLYAVGKGAYSGTASADFIIKLLPNTPTNVARATGNALPKAFSSYCPHDGGSKDSPANVIDGKKDFADASADKDVWSDWESGVHHTLPWVGVLLGDNSGIKPAMVSKVSIGFFDEKKGDTAGNAVRVPTDYDVQYYDGPTFDYGGEPKLVSQWEDSPLNDAENWKTVTYKSAKPDAPAGADATHMTTVEIEPVAASFFRVVMTPQENQWVGAVELEVYGVAMHTVEFANNGGSPVTSQTVTNGEKLTAFADPTKDGYTFDGWYKEAALENAWDFDTDTVTEDITLYAKWTQNTPPPAIAPTITTESLPAGVVGTAYSQTLTATGDTPITWSVSEGSLPTGLSLSGDAITGSPSEAGTANFTVQATNTAGSDTQALSITITAPTPTVTSVTVSPETATVQKGKTQQFTAAVTGENDPAQTVTWSVEGSHAEDTVISDAGLLTVAADEAETTLTVKAASTVDSAKSGTATVTVTEQEVTRYTLTVVSGTGSGAYAEGAEITVTAEMPQTGKQFKEWTADGITLENAAQTPITITMPAGEVTLTATYEDIPTVVDKKALAAAIAAANTAKDGVIVSDQTADQIAKGTKFVTTDETQALTDAIAAAAAVNGKGDATQADVNSAVTALNTAVTAFTAAIKTGTKEGTPAEVPVTGVTLDKATASVRTGETVQLTAAVAPANATNKAVAWASGDTAVATVDANGLVTAVAAGTAKITVTAADGGKTAACTVTVTRKSSGGSGSSGSSSNTTTTTETKPNGDKVTTVTDKSTGASTVTTVAPDGGKSEVKTDKDGKQTATVTLPAGSTGAVTLPMPEMKPEANADKAPSVTVKTDKPVTVVVPTKNGSPSVVAVIENADGTETVVPKSVMGEDGLIVSLPGSVTFKLVDNGKTFADVQDGNWASDAVQFVASRELFQGTSATTFSPDQAMNRAMLVTVLWRLESKPEGKGAGFADVPDAAYYAQAVKWAAENGIVTGTGGGFDPQGNITREQLAAILYRYAGSPAIGSDLPYRFDDRDEVSGWASDAMTWAIQNNIITGKTAQTIAPKDSATRAEVAVMLQRFVSKGF